MSRKSNRKKCHISLAGKQQRTTVMKNRKEREKEKNCERASERVREREANNFARVSLSRRHSLCACDKEQRST
jgi:hypothetical protein